MKRRLALLVFMVGLLCTCRCLLAATEPGPTTTLDVVGRGNIYKDNVAQARDEAIVDALQNAVEAAVALLISPATVIDQFQVLADRVYSQGEGFIQDYKVIAEAKSGRYYRVAVRATLMTAAIRAKLQSLGVMFSREAPLPSVLLLVSEQNAEDLSPRRWWAPEPGVTEPDRSDRGASVVEDTLSAYLKERGFAVVEHSRAAVSQMDPSLIQAEIDDQTAAELGRRMGADVVIVGNAVAQRDSQGPEEVEKRVLVTVILRALSTEGGAVVGSSQGTKTAVGFDAQGVGAKSMALAASQLGDDLTRQIVASAGRQANRTTSVELLVRGIGHYADFIRLRSMLKNDVTGVTDVNLRAIKAGEAMIDVDYRGSAHALAEALTTRQFGDLAVHVTGVEENRVAIQLGSEAGHFEPAPAPEAPFGPGEVLPEDRELP